MKVDMIAFYRVEYREKDGQSSMAHRYTRVPVEIPEIAAAEAPVALIHHFQPQIMGNLRYPIPYRLYDGRCRANTEVSAEDFKAFNSRPPAAIHRSPGISEYFDRPCAGDYGYVAVGGYEGAWLREAKTEQADHAGREVVESERSAARRLCRILEHQLVVIEGAIWRYRSPPELIVLPPSGAKDGGKAARIHPTVSHPFTEHRLFRPVPTHQEMEAARIDDRLFRLDEEADAKARAAEYGAKLYMPDRFEILDPAALSHDPSKAALEAVGKALLDATDPGDDPAFSNPDFAAARQRLHEVVRNDDVVFQVLHINAAAIVPELRSFLAAFGADELVAAAAEKPKLAALVAAGHRVHERTQKRMASGITYAVSSRQLDRPDDEALGGLAP
jgi:hypothetical protein